MKYATITDFASFGKELSEQEMNVSENLIDVAEAKLQVIAKKYNKNIDEMCKDESFALTVKSTIIQAVIRALNSMQNASPIISQSSQSALGYSASMTYLNPGQSIYFLRNELKDLGLIRQSYGALDLYGSND